MWFVSLSLSLCHSKISKVMDLSNAAAVHEKHLARSGAIFALWIVEPALSARPVDLIFSNEGYGTLCGFCNCWYMYSLETDEGSSYGILPPGQAL